MKKINLGFYKESIKKLSINVPILPSGMVFLMLYIIIYVIFGVDIRGLLIFSLLSIFMGCYFIILIKLRDRKDKREAKNVE